MKRAAITPTGLLVVASLLSAGCGSNPTTPTNPTSQTEGAIHSEHDHATHAKSTGSDPSGMEAVSGGLAELSPEDRASAEKQRVCPVSGEMLGSMGTPQKVEVNGQQVWICCPGCKDQLLENADEYLAKLAE